MVWTEAIDLVCFEDPVELDFIAGTIGELVQRGKRYRDLYKLCNGRVLEEVFNSQCSFLSDKGDQLMNGADVLSKWQSQWHARCGLKTKARREDGQGIFGSMMRVIFCNEFLQLVMAGACQHIGLRFSFDRRAG